MTMTKAEIKAEWIRRLRSGEYQQGKRRLCYYGRHCCLGVLCEIAAEHGVIAKPIKIVNGDYDDCGEGESLIEFGGETKILPDEVREWAGLSTTDGRYYYDHIVTSLANLNDDKRKTFPEIADIIKSHPKGLFTWEEDHAAI